MAPSTNAFLKTSDWIMHTSNDWMPTYLLHIHPHLYSCYIVTIIGSLFFQKHLQVEDLALHPTHKPW
jgi:hypothetical protein